MGFVHLHNHTHHSKLDGLQAMDEMIAAVKADGQSAVAVTDHGTLSGTWELHTAARDAGIKPILGIEAYLSIGSRWEQNTVQVPAEDDYDGSAATESTGRMKTKRYEHLTLLAANRNGWRNLVELANRSEDSYFYKPRMDFALLGGNNSRGGKLSEGIVVGTGCLGGPIAGPLLRDDYDSALANLNTLVEIYGRDRVFVEVMDHGIPGERRVISGLVQVARQAGVKVIATNDAHYTDPDQARVHDAFLCISQKRGAKPVTVDEKDRFRFNGSGYHMRTEAEMRAIFDNQPGTEDACDNTLLVADMIEDDVIGETRTRLPKFNPPKEKHTFTLGTHEVEIEAQPTAGKLLYELVRQGAIRRYGLPFTKDLKKRLRREINVIAHFGYEDYFLIMFDAIAWARSDRGLPTTEYPNGKPGEKRPILVGPGRGSAAGSAVAYCLWITNVEPISNGLLFERFLDPSRFDFPDIDTDFQADRRHEVQEYMKARWGHERVALLGTFMASWSKRSIKDMARVTNQNLLGAQVCSHVYSSAMASETPLSLQLSGDYPLGRDLRELVQKDQRAAKLVKDAQVVEGAIVGASVHACGIVVGDEDLPPLMPLRHDRRPDKKGDNLVTEWSPEDVADFGMVKLDFLAIQDLTVVSETLKSIEHATGETVNIDDLPVGNGVYANSHDERPTDVVARDNERAAKAWALIGAGKTSGVFQLASGGITRLARSVRPENLGHLAAIVALYRPGPMSSGEHEKFARRLRGGEPVTYTDWTDDPAETEVIASVVSKTMGSITYQEDLMQLSRVIADFNDAEVNKLRKAAAKKKKDIMNALYVRWIEGGTRAVRYDWVGDGKGKVEPRLDDNGNPVVIGEKVAFQKKTLDALWRTFEGAGAYLFNSSHAYAYGYVSYMTAFLKANWPAHFGAALLSSVETDEKRIAMLRSLSEFGIKVAPPSVNLGGEHTGVDENGVVRLGLTEVTGGGVNASYIVQERIKNGPFSSIHDILNRVRIPAAGEKGMKIRKLPVNTVEALIEAGALDEFGIAQHGEPCRKGMLMIVRASEEHDLPIPHVEFGVEDLAIRERSRLGLNMVESPLRVLGDQVKKWREPTGRNSRPIPVHRIPRERGQSVSTVGVLSSLSERQISTGLMWGCHLEGTHGGVEVNVWPNKVKEFLERGDQPVPGMLLGVTGLTKLYTPPSENGEDEADAILSVSVDSIWRGQLVDEPLYDIPTPASPLAVESLNETAPELPIEVPDIPAPRTEPEPPPAAAAPEDEFETVPDEDEDLVPMPDLADTPVNRLPVTVTASDDFDDFVQSMPHTFEPVAEVTETPSPAEIVTDDPVAEIPVPSVVKLRSRVTLRNALGTRQADFLLSNVPGLADHRALISKWLLTAAEDEQYSQTFEVLGQTVTFVASRRGDSKAVRALADALKNE